MRRLAADGALVAVNDVADAASAEALVGELTHQGHRAVAMRADIADPDQTRDPAGAGRRRIRRAGNLGQNAGVEHFGALDTISRADVDRVFGINVGGQLFAAQAAAAAMG